MWPSAFSTLKDKWDKVRRSKVSVIVLVFSTLMLDSLLLTSVVPILPEFFYKQHLKSLERKKNVTSTETPTFTTIDVTKSNLSIFTTVGVTSRNSVEKSFRKCNHPQDNAYLASESLYIGVLYASKPIVQVFSNLAVGPVTDRIGFNVPMFVGYLIICVSASIFAFGSVYPVLFSARSIQGLGSACASTSGMGLLADTYSDEPEERGKAMGLALSGIAVGVLVGPVFGSVVYQLAGKEVVFLVLAVMAIVLAVAQLCLRNLKIERCSPGEEGTPLTTLLRDPYILIAAGSVMLGNFSIAVLETGQPIWMLKTMCPKKWELGIAFLPASISYLIGTYVCSLCCQKWPNWLVCMLSLYISCIGCVTLPFARSLVEIIGPGSLIGFSIALTDLSILPLMATLVDQRHNPVYGSVYAITDVSFCVAVIAGPFTAGGIISTIGFAWLMRIVAIIIFLFAPLVYLLRKPTLKNEETESEPLLNGHCHD